MTGCGRYTVKSESPNENECKCCGGTARRKKHSPQRNIHVGTGRNSNFD